MLASPSPCIMSERAPGAKEPGPWLPSGGHWWTAFPGDWGGGWLEHGWLMGQSEAWLTRTSWESAQIYLSSHFLGSLGHGNTEQKVEVPGFAPVGFGHILYSRVSVPVLWGVIRTAPEEPGCVLWLMSAGYTMHWSHINKR